MVSETSSRSVFAIFVIFFLVTLGVFISLRDVWSPILATRWLILALLILGFELYILVTNLHKHQNSESQKPYTHLGIANIATLLRGYFLALMGGFLFSPWPPFALAWFPGILYITASIIDLFDGYLARKSNIRSGLGEFLDLEYDALGILIAPALAVWYGQLPWWYLSVSLVRYLFILHIAIRKRQNLPFVHLQHNPFRRILAGLQMAFIGTVLLPFFGPPMTHVAGIAFILPFLSQFGFDWLSTIGVLERVALTEQRRAQTKKTFVFNTLPIVLRGGVSLGIAGYFMLIMKSPQLLIGKFSQVGISSPIVAFWITVTIYSFAGLSILLGFGARMGAIVLLIYANAIARVLGQTDYTLILITLGTPLILQLGSGALSLWKPEDRIFNKRMGET